MLGKQLLLFGTMLLFIPPVIANNSFCKNPIHESKVDSLFHKLAVKQLNLEFGDEQLEMYGEIHSPVGQDLFRVEAYAKFIKPGRKDKSTMRVTGWLSRCQGTLVIRGNTWLANGTLAVTRYDKDQLIGQGMVLGNPNAPTKVIAFVDSRCPHCHRLIGYARELIKDGKLMIDIRQVVFLEEMPEALKDTQLFATRLVSDSFSISDKEYLDMLTGFASDETVDKSSSMYTKAKQLLTTNTNTAKNLLHMTTVPALLVQDKNKQYRLTSYWEMNRLLQPDL